MPSAGQICSRINTTTLASRSIERDHAMHIAIFFSFLELRSRRSALFPGRSTRSASSNEVDSDDESLALVDTNDRRRSPTDRSHQERVKSVQNSLRSIMPAINGTPTRIDTRTLFRRSRNGYAASPRHLSGGKMLRLSSVPDGCVIKKFGSKLAQRGSEVSQDPRTTRHKVKISTKTNEKSTRPLDYLL